MMFIFDGVLWFDIWIGFVLICIWNGIVWVCYVVLDEWMVFDVEIGRFQVEVEKFKVQIVVGEIVFGKISEVMLKVDFLLKFEFKVVESECKIEILFFNDQDVDWVMLFMERVWWWLIEMVNCVQRDVLG